MQKISQKSLVHPSQAQITLIIKAAAIAISTIALFSQDLILIFTDALRSEITSYILAIPFLFAYLIYRKRKMLRATIPLESQSQPKITKHLAIIAGVLLTATAVLLYWRGSYTFTPLEYHMLALPILVAGLCLILFNQQTLRQLAFPIAFLLFLTPPPSEILYNVGAILQALSAEASNAIVNFFGISSTLSTENGSPLITIVQADGSSIPFSVDIACSGIYSLIGFLIFIIFVTYIIRDKPWKKLTLFLIGLPLVYLLNILRITIMLVIGYHYGEDLALQVFHLLGGWVLIFLGTLLLLVISEKAFKTQVFTSPAKECSKCDQSLQSNQSFCTECGRILKPPTIKLRRIDLVKTLAIVLSVVLLLSIEAPVFALTQAPPLVITTTPSGEQASTSILPQGSSHNLSEYDLSFLYRDTNFEVLAKQDMSLVYLYSPTNESLDPIWVSVEIASTRSSLHRWEACLITVPLSRGLQPKVSQMELRDIQLIENPPLIARYFVFNDTSIDAIQAVLYWYESVTFTVNSTAKQEQIKTSLVAYPETTDDLPRIESQLITVATAVTSYWQPIKTWSQISLLLSQNGTNLAIVTVALLASLMIFYAFETRRQRKTNRKIYEKLSEPNKQMIDIIRKTEKTSRPTLNSIATTYKNVTKQSIPEDRLLEKLLELENTGTIRSAVANVQDQPVQTWKTQIS